MVIKLLQSMQGFDEWEPNILAYQSQDLISEHVVQNSFKKEKSIKQQQVDQGNLVDGLV